MSKYINVNPDHYKVAGRERPDTLAQVRQNTRLARADERRERSRRSRKPGPRPKSGR